MIVIEWRSYVPSPRTSCVPTWIEGTSRYAYPEHTHSGQTEVMAVLEGTIDHRLNGASESLEAGMAVWIDEKERHQIVGRSGKIRLLNLAYPTDLAVELDNHVHGDFSEAGERSCAGTGGSASGDGLPRGRRLSTDQLNRFIEYGELLTGAAGPMQRIILTEFLLWFSRSFRGAAAQRSETALGAPAPCPAWLADLRSWAEMPGAPPPTFSGLVAQSGKSPEHLCRSFSRCMACTPGAYLNGLRLRRARDLLAHSNWSLADVCFASGFESLSRFYSLFARTQGISPGRYRKERIANPYTTQG